MNSADEFWVPCPHGIGRVGNEHETLPNYHPLTRVEVEAIVRFAMNAKNVFDHSRAVIRLCQGIPGMTCPYPMNGDVAQIRAWVQMFMVDMAARDRWLAPLPVLVRVLASD